MDLQIIAKEKHAEDHNSNKYPFLNCTEENAATYAQGFMQGIRVACSIIENQKSTLPINVDVFDCPTLNRQL